jgi:hypothetical protein
MIFHAGIGFLSLKLLKLKQYGDQFVTNIGVSVGVG